MRAAACALALLLLLGPATCRSEKTWKEWFWSEFKPEAGGTR